MTIEAAAETGFLHIVISLAVLLFAAKIFAELFARLRLPIVLGELVAGNERMKVGIGMISRGEIGLIVAGVGVSTGIFATDTYTSIIIMVAVTTIITPIWLKITYKKENIATS